MLLQLLSVLIIHSTPFDEVAQGPSPPKASETPLKLKDGKTVQVTQFRFSGNEAIPTQQLQSLVSNYENRILTEVELQEIQKRIEILYKSKGYLNVKVMIPEKQKSGSLEIVIQEGKKMS